MILFLKPVSLNFFFDFCLDFFLAINIPPLLKFALYYFIYVYIMELFYRHDTIKEKTRYCMEKISDIFISWYQKNKRDLPWRENKNPYYIWVSEIMLQQTRVEAVKPYFKRFISTLPSIEDLATIPEDTLLKLWEGLGYYSRVRNMQKAAQMCVKEYEGKLPANYDALLLLPGIGPYTAGAIASIAFNASVCAIDGNVLRVYARLFAVEEDILQQKTKNKIQLLIEQDKAQNMGDMNQAIMDFGSSICISANPRCNICPLTMHCQAYQEGKQIQLPIRKKASKKKKEKYTVVIYTYKNKVLIHKRTSPGLLHGVYEFVTIENHLTKKHFGTKAQYLGKYTHVFSHVEWHLKGYVVPVTDRFEKPDHIWVTREQIKHAYSIPGAFKTYQEKALGG